jgi:hypothetical protein
MSASAPLDDHRHKEFSSFAASRQSRAILAANDPDPRKNLKEAYLAGHFTALLVHFSDAPRNFLPSCGEWFRMNECSFTV